MAPENDREQALEREEARRAAGRRVLKTLDGTELLELLEERWTRRLPGKTADQMQANAGAMEVIAYLRRLRERKEG